MEQGLRICGPRCLLPGHLRVFPKCKGLQTKPEHSQNISGKGKYGWVGRYPPVLIVLLRLLVLGLPCQGIDRHLVPEALVHGILEGVTCPSQELAEKQLQV